MQAAQEPAPSSIDDRKATRVDLKRKVAFRFDDLEGFMTEYLLNLSATGMFIHSQNPQPKGTVLDFEFSLADGDALIHGYGEVMWARRQDGGPDKPAGMGIRFLHLDEETREFLRWFVTRRYITGGGPCDMDELRQSMRRADPEEETAFAPLAPPEPETPKAAKPPPTRPTRPRQQHPGAFREIGYAAAHDAGKTARRLRLAAALAATVLGGLYGLSRIAVPVAAWANARVAAATEATAPEVEVAAAAAAPTSEVTAPIAADLSEALGQDRRTRRREATELAHAWASAWSSQEVEAYLACYAADFRAPGGQGRAAWAASRRTRILKPTNIEVRLGGVAAELVDANRAHVRFEQTYRSDSYRDTVHKTLELVREGEAWRIVEERVES